jgi:Calx-beta domain/Bacterial Ig-like domain (group 3)/Bacterial Ig-like domain (group 1)
MRSSGWGRTGRAILALAFVAFVFMVPAGAADPAPPPSLSINDVTMNEGNTGTTTNFVFTVTLANPPSGNFTIMVNYATANGTATAGACASGFDYIAASGQLTFNRNNLTRTVTVQVCVDTVFEPNETFSVNLSSPTGGAVITKSPGVGTIMNDDAAPVRSTATSVSCGAPTVGIGATCTATVTDTDSGTKTTPTGTVTFSSTKPGTFAPNPCGLTPTATVGVASCTTTYTPTEAGTATITAHYNGDLTHAESEGTTTVTIAKRTTKTEVSCGALTVGIGATCTATVTDTDSGTKTTPTGTVTFSSTKPGTFAPNPCGLTPTATVGVASCTTTYTPTEAGTATITAHYNGDLTHAESEGTTTVTIAKRTTKTEVSCQDSSFEAGGSTTCTATVTDTDGGTKTIPTGTVNWSSTADATFAPNPCGLTPTATVGVASCEVLFSTTKAATHTISATYGGDPVHDGSTGSTMVKVTPGPPFTVTLEPLAATNQLPEDTEHCVTATVKDKFGNATPGVTVRFTVTGANPTTGSAQTNNSGEAKFCYTGVLVGEDVIKAFADTNGDRTQQAGEPSETAPATKTWVAPQSTPLCVVDFGTYGIQITAQNGDQGTGGGNVHVSEALQASGSEEYQDHGPVEPMNVHSTEIVAVVCIATGSGKQATIYFVGDVDGAGPRPGRIEVEDNGEPGTNDTYWIMVSKGTSLYNSGKQSLQGGNVQIH